MKELTGIRINTVFPDNRIQLQPVPKKLTAHRILSIDLFRGITILIMVFVNELADMRNIPAWMKHMTKDVDGMSFVDVVFPAFLFIAGMSIPFALNKRRMRGESNLTIQLHVIWRTIGLLLLGLFMVNAEWGYEFSAMPMNIHIWGILSFVAAILIWNVYRFKNKIWANILKGFGVAILIYLAIIYRGGDTGGEHMSPHWWGILGLIGWAYLFNCIFYQLFSGKIIGSVLLMILCAGLFIVTMYNQWETDEPGKIATHIAIMAGGVIASLILFDESRYESLQQRFSKMFFFALVLFAVGYLLQPYFQVSKINSTPSWGLYSTAICCILYCIFYWFIDYREKKQWTSFFCPAAANPLLIYIIPDIIFHLNAYFHFSFIPDRWRAGVTGILWSACYAMLIMWVAAGMNKMKVKLQL